MSHQSLQAISAVHTRLTQESVPTKEQLPLAAHTTIRIGGPAALAAFPENEAGVRTVLQICREANLPCAVVGAGSNLLCPDNGFAGCVLFTSGLRGISFDGTCVTAGAGVSLTALCCAARDRSLAGLAFAHGIPGSVGGAVYMNAGAYGGEVGDRITSVTVLNADTGTVTVIPHDACAFGYRTSAFTDGRQIVLSADFALEPGDSDAIRAEMEDISARRRDKQPLEYPSAGSAFKRYPGRFTAQLIDEAGLKGYAVGGAQVSEKHAGFIVNRGGATCTDVLTLIDRIRDRIEALHGIRIEPEIRLLSDCLVHY